MLTIGFFFIGSNNHLIKKQIQVDCLGKFFFICFFIGCREILIGSFSFSMIAHSQPGTPRPENTSQQGSPIYQQPTPFPARTSVRGRTSLFANETGPYFSPVEPFENLYSSDKTTL